MWYYRFFPKFYESAAERMCLDCQGFIKKGAKILDLGCGTGVVGKKFQDFFQGEVLGVDVEDRRTEKIPFQIIDGFHLPFPDKSFDTVLIAYVLHHSRDPIFLLKEVKRVLKDKIILFEDLPEDILSKIICHFHGLNWSRILKNQNALSFTSEKEWGKIFDDLELKIIFKKRRSSFPVKKELFILGA